MAVIQAQMSTEIEITANKLRKEISKLLKKEIYLPLADLAVEEGRKKLINAEIKELKNSGNKRAVRKKIQKLKIELKELDTKILNTKYGAIIKAIKELKIYYSQNMIQGSFNSKISKEIRDLGGVWSIKEKGYRIDRASLPKQVNDEFVKVESGFQDRIARMVDKMKSIESGLVAEKFSAKGILDDSIFRMEKSVDRSLKRTLKKPKKGDGSEDEVAAKEKDYQDRLEDITVSPQLSKTIRKQLTEEYNENLKKDIKGWLDEEVLSLRQKVEELVFEGARPESLEKIIQRSYNVSSEKAKFIASQETRLLTAKFRESRYREAGSKGYYWKTVVGSANHPVRPMHKQLGDRSKAGEIFSWDNPPVTSEDGRRNHPGEDYNCRCYPQVVI